MSKVADDFKQDSIYRGIASSEARQEAEEDGRDSDYERRG